MRQCYLFVQKFFQRRSSASYFIVSFLYLLLLFLRRNFGFHTFYTEIHDEILIEVTIRLELKSQTSVPL